ncbi:MAG: glycosyltransferase family protein [bacterium]|nr:glycosyltransferase family protein [bacterium]
MSNIAFIAARMGSERMPGKVMMKLAGIPSLVHIFNILRETKTIDDLAVLTTTLQEDDTIEATAKENGVKVFRGEVNDVLSRFRIAAESLKPKRIIRVTGDDPLMDPEIIDKVVGEHFNGDYDYTSNIVERTYPRGMDTEVIEYASLEKSWLTTDDEDDKEHVTLYIRRHPEIFRINNVKRAGKRLDDIRLCLDTEEDAKVISAIFDTLYNGVPIRLDEAIEFLDKNPELKKINSGIQQKAIKGKVY